MLPNALTRSLGVGESLIRFILKTICRPKQQRFLVPSFANRLRFSAPSFLPSGPPCSLRRCNPAAPSPERRGVVGALPFHARRPCLGNRITVRVSQHGKITRQGADCVTRDALLAINRLLACLIQALVLSLRRIFLSRWATTPPSGANPDKRRVSHTGLRFRVT